MQCLAVRRSAWLGLFLGIAIFLLCLPLIRATRLILTGTWLGAGWLVEEIALLGHGVWMGRGLCRVYAPNPEAATVRELVAVWYRDQAARYFPERVAALAPVLGVHASRVIVSNAKTQWGSCNSEGSVRLNWRLMQARPAVIDYVVAHELAHLRHMNHSPAFWATVTIACPHYRKLREELKERDVSYRVL